MSSLTLNGDTSGSILIQAPAVAGSGTLTLPTGTGTILAGGPAFSAYASASTSLSAGTTTKIQFQTEEFDTANCYDTSTYRFTPTVAGYYQVTACVAWNSASNYAYVHIAKNGSTVKQIAQNNAYALGIVLTALIYMNGSTDYLEVYGNCPVSNSSIAGSLYTYFQAYLARAA